jgi:DNA-binding XRE family transcriptional regulator
MFVREKKLRPAQHCIPFFAFDDCVFLYVNSREENRSLRPNNMNPSHIASRIRSHRKKAGLNQMELARILDLHKAQVSRHERAGIEPPLIVVLSYEAVFGVAVRELYPRLYAIVKQGIEERLAILESDLQHMSVKGRRATAIAHKLEWLNERKSVAFTDLV